MDGWMDGSDMTDRRADKQTDRLTRKARQADSHMSMLKVANRCFQASSIIRAFLSFGFRLCAWSSRVVCLLRPAQD